MRQSRVKRDGDLHVQYSIPDNNEVSLDLSTTENDCNFSLICSSEFHRPGSNDMPRSLHRVRLQPRYLHATRSRLLITNRLLRRDKVSLCRNC